ncbi:hypothetical protein D3C87_181590 [compost metagenome]
MNRIQFVLLCLLIPFPVLKGFSQQFQISEIEKERSIMDRVIVIDSIRFILVSKEALATKEVTVLKRYENRELISKQRLPCAYNNHTISYKQFEWINDTLRAYFSTPSPETFDYYSQSLDEMGQALGEPRHIYSFPRLSNKIWNSGGLLFASDKLHYLIFSVVTDNKDESKLLQFAYFSNRDQLINSGEIPGTKNAQDVQFGNIWITRRGKIIVSESVHYKKTIDAGKMNRRMEALRLHVIRPDTTQVITLMPPEEQYLTQIALSIGEHKIQGQGIYCAEQDHFSGIYTFQASDTNSSEVTIHLLPRSNSPELLSFDLRLSNKDPNPEKTGAFVCNDMKHSGIFSDGDSTLFVWERIATIHHQNSESFQSRDLLITEMWQDSIIRCLVIPKSTVSTRGHPKNISSYVEQKSPHELRFFFNDYADLYNPAGIYQEHSHLLKRNRHFSAPFGIVEVIYNLRTHSYTRRLLFDKTEFEIEAMPMYWTYAGKQKMLLQFASSRKYRFAYWNF